MEEKWNIKTAYSLHTTEHESSILELWHFAASIAMAMVDKVKTATTFCLVETEGRDNQAGLPGLIQLHLVMLRAEENNGVQMDDLLR